MGDRGESTARTAVLATVITLLVVVSGTVAVATFAGRGSDAAPNTLDWVALGDSYSAGNGGPGPESAFCHRDWETSYQNQARMYLWNSFNVRTDWKISLEACSGAVTHDLWRSQPGKTNGGSPRPQLDAVDSGTDVVTMTMGGNDAGFATTLNDCHFWGGPLQAFMKINPGDWFPGCWGRGVNDVDWSAIELTLTNGYADIRREMNRDGHLFLLTYPYLFATGDNFDGSLGTCEGISSGAVKMATDGQNKVAETIQKAAAAANSTLAGEGIAGHIHVIDVRSVDNWKSAAHGLCSKTVPRSDWFINAANLAGDGLDSFHPTPRGYQHMGYWLAEEMAKVYRTGTVPATPAPPVTAPPTVAPVQGVLGLDLTEMLSDGVPRKGRWGYGAAPGEAVELAIFDDAGRSVPTTAGSVSVAGADGRFNIAWVCDPPEVGRSWRLTMRGRTSGRTGEQWIACVGTTPPPPTAPPVTPSPATTPPATQPPTVTPPGTSPPVTNSPPAATNPPAPASTPPVIASFNANVSGTTVQMVASIGWTAGTDPIVCTFTVDGNVVLSQQCGTTPSYTVSPGAGTHTFQLRICNKNTQCVTSSPVSRTIGSPTPPPTQPPATFNETTGGVANTWTNYTNAGGTAGPQIAKGQTVAISCRLEGFRVANGNTWWYRIASAPWNNNFYVSADVFYNNGATSGSLAGTPYVDTAVPLC